uniref:Otopetrin n=1 Tax=Macrostomum lignano TaxID=282301 RepID=A0A1I8HTH5_9PLAT
MFPNFSRPSQLGFVADHSATPSKSLMQSLLTLYGMVILMLGVVIPISDALAKPAQHADYRQMFYIFMHGIGAVSIMYLDALIAFHKSDPNCSASRSAVSGQPLATVPEIRFEEASTTPPDSPNDAANGASELELLTTANNVPTGDRGAVFENEDKDNDDEEEEEKDEAKAADDRRISRTLAEPAEIAESVAATEAAETRLYLKPLPFCSGGSNSASANSMDSMTGTATGATTTYGGGGNRAQTSCRVFFDRVRRRLKVAKLAIQSKIDKIKKKRNGRRITWSAAGVNIYLRLGSVIFGFGVMVHDGFKIVDVLEKPDSAHCAGPWFLPKQVIHLIFIVCQTYYLFKHHRVTINTQKPLVRFILVHLMVTNLCIWGKTVIYEIKLSIMHLANTTEHHSNGTGAKQTHSRTLSTYLNATSTGHYQNGSIVHPAAHYLSKCDGLQLPEEDSPSHKLGPYLYPCAVEYGLICAAICFKLFARVGDVEVVPYGRKESPQGPRATTCHKSHKGLFLGLFIMICVLVPTISLIFLQRENEPGRHRDQHALAVIAVECLVLVCTSGMAVLGTVKAVRKLKLYKLHGSEAFDVNLLFVGLAGIICYNLFVTISVGACLLDPAAATVGPTVSMTRELGSGIEHCQWGSQFQFNIARLTGLKSFLEVTQSVAQTLFIMQAIQRKVTLQLAEGLSKPGRGTTIALLIANLAMWVASVFESQRDIADQLLLNYFGSMPWYGSRL